MHELKTSNEYHIACLLLFIRSALIIIFLKNFETSLRLSYLYPIDPVKMEPTPDQPAPEQPAPVNTAPERPAPAKPETEQPELEQPEPEQSVPEHSEPEQAAPKFAEPETLPTLLFGPDGAAAAISFSFRVSQPSMVTTTVFDPDGELRLEIGPFDFPVLACLVCPRTVSRASKVFKKMLYGNFAESKPKEGEWVVKLPEDDPDAMAFVLNILHGHFDKIPETLTQDKLYRVTVVTNKYDLTASLRPWASMWLQNLEDRTVINMLSCSQRIWIAWELGDTNLFKFECDFLLRNAPGESFKSTNEVPGVEFLESLGLIGMLQVFRKLVK